MLLPNCYQFDGFSGRALPPIGSGWPIWADEQKTSFAESARRGGIVDQAVSIYRRGPRKRASSPRPARIDRPRAFLDS
jgi:hypothetical protein